MRSDPIAYPEHGNAWCAAVEERSFWFQHRNRFLLELTKRYPPEAPLFDIGGGNGYVAQALQRAGTRAVVIEPGARGAEMARARGLEAICATLDDAGIAPATMPSAGLFDVLEHIEDA